MASTSKNVKPVDDLVKEEDKEVKAPGTDDMKENTTLTKLKVAGYPIIPLRLKKIPILDPVAESRRPVKVPVPRKPGPNVTLSFPADSHPLVLATYLVPSLPIEIFELLAEKLEKSLQSPVILVHESRIERPVDKNFIDIAILPASKDWKEGRLLEVGLVFKHNLNKNNKNPGVYIDIVVARDTAENIEDILDLRGHSCALPDRYTNIGATGSIFNYLKNKGENPSFFGNTLDSRTHIAALQMVAGKQADIAVLDAPVINSHKNNLPGVGSLFILDSLGPLPPYQIMLNEKLTTNRYEEIKKCLLAGNHDKDWIESLNTYGVIGMAEYSKDNYDVEDIKSVATSVRYY